MSFWSFQFSQKTNKKFNFTTTMVPQVELFSFYFWENWRHQKDISKLTDLYLSHQIQQPFLKLKNRIFLNVLTIYIYFYKLYLFVDFLFVQKNIIGFKRLRIRNFGTDDWIRLVVNFFHISHNLTWYSAIVHKFTRIYPVCSTYELTKQYM